MIVFMSSNSSYGILFRSLKGVEYMLVRSEPPSLFIIHKQERLSEEEGEPMLIASNG